MGCSAGFLWGKKSGGRAELVDELLFLQRTWGVAEKDGPTEWAEVVQRIGVVSERMGVSWVPAESGVLKKSGRREAEN